MTRTISRSPFMICVAVATLATVTLVISWFAQGQDARVPKKVAKNEIENTETAQSVKHFQQKIQPLVKKLCFRCHNVDEMMSGIRVDRLDGTLPDKQLFLWRDIQKQIAKGAMPPEDELQPTAAERKMLVDWIGKAMVAAKSRDAQKNGSVRRLTVSQYRNTLRDLLGLEDNLTDILPPDSVSKDGFLNNEQTMLLSPLLIEAYFDIAERALDRCIVDEQSKPVVQNFRMDFGAKVNPQPLPNNLILGANSHLLRNEDFRVTELKPAKPFAFTPFKMRTKYRFIEGYQGNATVRGWKEYDSIYHAVFACMRGTNGYPKGKAYESIPSGLLLRPSIPSAELFQVESTYGPKANFKISLRELPDEGRFRVTVKAAKYNDGLLLEPNMATQAEPAHGAVTIKDLTQPRTANVTKAGVYQADVYLTAANSIAPDATKLKEGLIGFWDFDGNAVSKVDQQELKGELTDGAKFVDSPFGKAVLVDGKAGEVVIPRDNAMNVGEGDFTVAAWIHPRGLRQGGIVSLGGYGYTHGWLLDMPNKKGILRIETATADNQHNGTVQSRPGVIQNNKWQHVAAVVGRGTNKTRLYVNGFEVGVGTVNPANLDNPKTALHIGRVQGANFFKGELDEVRIYRRALGIAEIKALVEPGKQFVQPSPAEKRKNLSLTLGDRHFSGLRERAFMVVRLPAGPLNVVTRYDGKAVVDRIVLTPLKETAALARRFVTFEKRLPRIGVHVGLRRDCGSTLTQVGHAQKAASSKLTEYKFEGAISNFPSPDVEKDNVNYLAGVREIGVRSEYTDGRDMPRLLIHSVEFEGPLYDTWPPATHRNIFVPSENSSKPAIYAREVIRSFATRAFRRPITDAEEAAVMTVWKNSFAVDGNFQQSVKDALLVVLTSPQFLFLIENSETPKPETLDSHELASKLSYFLWNTAPDKQLKNLAAANRLHKSLDAEVARMVGDPRFKQFTSEFATQWLSLGKFDVVEIDRKRYPTLTRDTRTQLRQEPVQYLQYLCQHNLPIANLVQSDFIVANEVVASYYGLAEKTESGFDFVPVKHANSNLGGVLSQAGILAGLSNGRESNPVKRGAWLARKIIAEPPDPPPPNVPGLPEDDTVRLTLRQKIERHRNQPGCVKCHAGIDPWGIPFEQFDAGGLLKKETIDARSTLPDDTEVANLQELKAYLATDRIDQVAFSFLKHLATYAVGRSLTYNEIEFLKEKGIELKADGYRTQDMIRFVIQSPLFLEK